MIRFSSVVLLGLLCRDHSSAFTFPQSKTNRPNLSIQSSSSIQKKIISSTSSSSTELHLFNKLLNKNNDDGDETSDEDETPETAKESKLTSFRKRLPFFASSVTEDDEPIPEWNWKNLQPKTTTSTSTTTAQEEGSVTTTTTSPTALVEETKPPPAPPKVEKLDPVAYAKQLKRQAVKARLEAEKMDAQLTLSKIESLEKRLKQSQEDGKSNKDKRADLENQIRILKQKLTGEQDTKDNKEKASSEQVSSAPTTTTLDQIPTIEVVMPSDSNTTAIAASTPEIKPISAEELEERLASFNKSPKFIQKLTASAAGYTLTDETNVTALIEQMYMDEQKYLTKTAYPNVNSETFGDNVSLSDEKIKELVEAFENLPGFLQTLTAKTAGVYEEGQPINATKVVLSMEMMVEEDDGRDKTAKITIEPLDKKDRSKFMEDPDTNLVADSPYGSKLFDDGSKIDLDEERQMIESLFPKSTRKEGETPTQAQMDLLYSQVLDKKIFQPSQKPEPISGGFLIRGTNQKENGNDLIEAIDAKLEKSVLEGKVSVFYINDPTPVTEEQLEMGIRTPVLLVTGPSVARNSTPILTTLLTAFGFGGISFLSLYPFLMNDDIAQKVDEQITLASTATGGANLDFLNEMTSPIFFTYVAIQIAHEAAHFAVSKINGFDTAVFPGWVPSPLLGLTSSITALRSSPKNKQALLDFAIAGPLTGILLSVVAIYVGLQITLGLDTAAYNALPVLPIAFLTQSSLGGGIVEAVLGEQTLTGVVNPATTTIHVHPFVIAGYASLLTNALNLTPFGRTDGGRISMALFGRSGAQLVGLLTLFSLFITGIFQGDALLLYFAFILFYQNELEIPLKNEVDEVDFSRVLLATFGGVLTLLTIIPM